MNILDVMDTDITYYLPMTQITIQSLFELRMKTYLGFLYIEQNKGFLKQGTPWATSQGQEMARILGFRVLEEMVEAMDSKDRNHMLEELIDAVNYLMELMTIHSPSNLDLNPPLIQVAGETYLTFESAMISQFGDVMSNREHRQVNFYDIMSIAISLGRFGDVLRNRSWMEQTQDIYFAGGKEFQKMCEQILIIIFKFFKDWEEFVKFFVAKDLVLQFRLKSKY